MVTRVKIATFIQTILLVLIGGIISWYIAENPIPRDGLYLMMLLPILGAIAAAGLVCYNREYNAGIGVYFFSGIIVIKYMLMPLMMSISGGYLKWYRKPGTQAQNEFAVFVMILELIISTLAIIYYIKKYNRIIQIEDGIDLSNISSVTWIVIIMICMICIIRYNRLIGNVHFLTLSDTETVGSYEQIALQVLKSYVFVRLVVLFKAKHTNNPKFRYVLFSLVAAIINCGLFFGINRSLIMQTAVATIMVLIYVYPNYRKIFIGTIIPIIVVLMLTITTLRHFNVELANASSDVFDVDILSTTIESYTCGPLPITSTIDAADKYRHLLGIKGMISDFVCNFFPFYFPGLSSIRDYFFDYGNTSQLYNQTIMNIGGMIPMIGQLSFYFGNYLAVAADICVYIWVARVLVTSSYKVSRYRSVEHKFYYAWLTTLFSFAMCYCLITFLWSWSKFGMFFLLLNWVNRRMILRRN